MQLKLNISTAGESNNTDLLTCRVFAGGKCDGHLSACPDRLPLRSLH